MSKKVYNSCIPLFPYLYKTRIWTDWNTNFVSFWGEFPFMLLSKRLALTFLCKELPSFPADFVVGFDLWVYHDPLLVYFAAPYSYNPYWCDFLDRNSNILLVLCIDCTIHRLNTFFNLNLWPLEWSTSIDVCVEFEPWCDICTLVRKFCSLVQVATAPCKVLGRSLSIFIFSWSFNNPSTIMSNSCSLDFHRLLPPETEFFQRNCESSPLLFA